MGSTYLLTCVVAYFIRTYQANPVIGALYMMKLCQLLEFDIQLHLTSNFLTFTHHMLVPSSRKCGYIHSLPHIPSWYSA
jgi:hypothetical protein